MLCKEAANKLSPKFTKYEQMGFGSRQSAPTEVIINNNNDCERLSSHLTPHAYESEWLIVIISYVIQTNDEFRYYTTFLSFASQIERKSSDIRWRKWLKRSFFVSIRHYHSSVRLRLLECALSLLSSRGRSVNSVRLGQTLKTESHAKHRDNEKLIFHSAMHNWLRLDWIGSIHLASNGNAFSETEA